ncbi:MAG: hypothetical protein AAB544_04485 [Patescibacteria group bacterium]
MPKASRPGDHSDHLTPQERRARICTVFGNIPASFKEKQEVRDAIGKIWTGGLYDSDATIQTGEVDTAMRALEALQIAPSCEDRRAEVRYGGDGVVW